MGNEKFNGMFWLIIASIIAISIAVYFIPNNEIVITDDQADCIKMCLKEGEDEREITYPKSPIRQQKLSGQL